MVVTSIRRVLWGLGLLAAMVSVRSETIDFENCNGMADCPAGTIIESVRSDDGGVGPIGVFGQDPIDPGPNYAIAFDTNNPTCGDSDLRTPTATAPIDLGTVIVVQDNSSTCAPNDISATRRDGVYVDLDFSAIGPVTVNQLVLLDLDGNGPNPRVELFNLDDILFKTIPLPQTVNNGQEVVDLGNTPGVNGMRVWLQGSGGFDRVVFDVPAPQIEICTLVTLNADMVSDFSDADGISGDGCDVFPQSIPVGVVGVVDGTYRLKITNTGPETLVNVRIDAPDFGLTDQPIPAACGDLDPGEMCVIDFDDPGFPLLKVPDVCVAPGKVNKIASVDGEGADSGISVSDDDPAIVDCVAEPDISLRKEVSLDGGPFLDANSPDAAPSGDLGADAEYKLIVENTGTETLVDAVINDGALGLINVPVPDGPLAPGDKREITSGSFGFGALMVVDRCDSAGTKLNMARVDAKGQTTGALVESEDPAYVNCEEPKIELLKQVSLDGINFFDADLPGDPDVPVGIVGLTDATYRLIVRNTGTEDLTDVRVEDGTLGIDVFIADLISGETRVLESGDAGFGNLFQPMRCGGTPGNKSNTATVTATGGETGTPVGDDDPANVRCIVGPGIVLLKQVSLDGVNFVDADTPADGPTGLVGGTDATYRLIVRNVGDEDLTSVVINDSTLGIVNESIADLPVGAEVVIDVGSFGKFNELFFPNRCDSAGDKLNIAEVVAKGALTGTPVDDDDPAYVSCEAPPSCAIELDKTCSVAPDTSASLLCESAIAATTLRYTGPSISDATVTFEGKKNGGVTYSGVDLVSGTVLTMASQNGFTIDGGDQLGSKTTITINGEVEIIHTSCSAIYAAGSPAPLDGGTPNPPNSDKGDPSPNWFVVNFRDKDGAFVTSGGGDGEFTDSCTFTQQPLPSCDSGPKPDTLTWRYDGGTFGDGNCADSTFLTIVNEDGKLHEDFECAGSVNTAQPITAVDDDGNTFSVSPGESFTTQLGDSKEISLSNSGGTQDLVFHTSCSQPLEAGATAGALTLAGLDDRGGARDVTYRYEVTNSGDPLTDIMVTDDQLGDIGQIAALGTGESETFTKVTQLIATTANTATASGVLGGDACEASDTVVVTAVAPTCAVTIQLDKIEDKKIKWKLTNASGIDATIETLTLAWPGSESLKKIKLDGAEILKDDLRAPPTTTVVESDWRKAPKDRRVGAGDTEKLEVEFTDDFPLEDDQPAGDFQLSVTFTEGCTVDF